MDERPELVFRAHLELSGIWGRVVRVIELAHNTVAIGMAAADRLEQGWMDLPSDTFHMQYSVGNPIPLEDMRAYWRIWVLAGGFRDVAETLAETLEDVHRVLALWALIPEGGQHGGHISMADIRSMEEGNRQFHKRNLPDKLDLLSTRFDFSLPADFKSELLSINATRNCLVHRAGVVSNVDIDKDAETFTLRWRNLNGYVKDSTGERPLKMPFETSQTDETYLVIKTEARSKTFSIGSRLALTADEFAGIAWTQLSVAQWAAQRLEQIGRAKGLEIAAPKLIENAQSL